MEAELADFRPETQAYIMLKLVKKVCGKSKNVNRKQMDSIATILLKVQSLSESKMRAPFISEAFSGKNDLVEDNL
jgi:hypothetical protein